MVRVLPFYGNAGVCIDTKQVKICTASPLLLLGMVLKCVWNWILWHIRLQPDCVYTIIILHCCCNVFENVNSHLSAWRLIYIKSA